MPRPFRRDTEHAVLGGVAAGLGEYFDVDPLLVRLGLVFLVFANGLGLLFYAVCWLVVPAKEQPDGGAREAAPGQKIADGVREAGERVVEGAREAGQRFTGELRQATGRSGGGRMLLGAFLILLGAVLLAEELHWLYWPHWARFSTLWPVVIIALGVALMMRAVRQRQDAEKGA